MNNINNGTSSIHNYEAHQSKEQQRKEKRRRIKLKIRAIKNSLKQHEEKIEIYVCRQIYYKAECKKCAKEFEKEIARRQQKKASIEADLRAINHKYQSEQQPNKKIRIHSKKIKSMENKVRKIDEKIGECNNKYTHNQAVYSERFNVLKLQLIIHIEQEIWCKNELIKNRVKLRYS